MIDQEPMYVKILGERVFRNGIPFVKVLSSIGEKEVYEGLIKSISNK